MSKGKSHYVETMQIQIPNLTLNPKINKGFLIMPKSIFIVCQKVQSIFMYVKKFKEIAHKQCKIQITNLTFEPQN